MRGNQGSSGAHESGERGFVSSFCVRDGMAEQIETGRGEEAPFVVIAALNDRHVMELAGGERGGERERQEFDVEIGRVTGSVLVGEDGAEVRSTVRR